MGNYLKINGADFSANAIGQVVFVIEPPVIVNEELVVKITATEYGGTIYYTTDGSNPTSQSNTYSEPFTVVEGTTIKAIVVVNGTASAVTSKIIESPWTPVDLSTIKMKTGIISESQSAYPDYESPISSSASTDLINKPFRITTKSGYVLKYLFYVDANTLKLTESPNTPGQNYDTIDNNTLTINPLAIGLNYQITIKKSDASNFGSETPSDIIDTFEILAG